MALTNPDEGRLVDGKDISPTKDEAAVAVPSSEQEFSEFSDNDSTTKIESLKDLLAMAARQGPKLLKNTLLRLYWGKSPAKYTSIVSVMLRFATLYSYRSLHG